MRRCWIGRPSPDGEYRILRNGTGDWTCLPGNPDYPPGDPGCFDRVFLQFVKDGRAGRAAHVDRVGISYMYNINHLPGRPEMFLVIPIRGWDERPR